MAGFGTKQAWLAIRGVDQRAVVDALGLRDLGEVPWRDGLDVAHLTDDRIAVTPPVEGWTLAAGRRLLNHPADVVDLSERLGTEVQQFATHRVTETHRWQRAAKGELVRAFGFVGQTGDVTTWFGDPTPVELELGLPAVYLVAEPVTLEEELAALVAEDTTILVSEQDVLRVAGAWSIDPSRLPGLGRLRVGAVL
ncbi:hypothetical protein [Symbioplanes lichenis]|uniref:hypothetical protein n=1 Tax=Symbioplanes lichenis TaxID=1629072 RepID=UPI0027392CF4|nr:hypothetical protein [Actinoplanes lichenis]